MKKPPPKATRGWLRVMGAQSWAPLGAPPGDNSTRTTTAATAWQACRARGHGDSVTRPEGGRDRLPLAPLALLVARLSGGMLRTPKDEARAGERGPDEGLRGLDEARGGLGRHSVSAPCGPPADSPPADPASLPVGDCSAHECTGLKVPRTAPEQRGMRVAPWCPRVTLRPPWDDSEGPRQGEPWELGRTPLVGACLSASPTSAPSYTPPCLVVTPGITSKVRRGSASRGSQPETRGGPRRPCLGRRRHGRLLARWRADRTVMRARSQAVAVSQTRHGPCECTC